MLVPCTKNKGIFKCPSDSESGLRVYSVNNNGNPVDPPLPFNIGEDTVFYASYRYNISNQQNGPWDALKLASLDMPAQASRSPKAVLASKLRTTTSLQPGRVPERSFAETMSIMSIMSRMTVMPKSRIAPTSTSLPKEFRTMCSQTGTPKA